MLYLESDPPLVQSLPRVIRRKGRAYRQTLIKGAFIELLKEVCLEDGDDGVEVSAGEVKSGALTAADDDGFCNHKKVDE